MYMMLALKHSERSFLDFSHIESYRSISHNTIAEKENNGSGVLYILSLSSPECKQISRWWLTQNRKYTRSPWQWLIGLGAAWLLNIMLSSPVFAKEAKREAALKSVASVRPILFLFSKDVGPHYVLIVCQYLKQISPQSDLSPPKCD